MNSENKALGSFQSAFGVHLKVYLGSILSAPKFVLCAIKLTLVHSQLNPVHFGRDLFSEFKQPKQSKFQKYLIVVVKAINLKVSLFVDGNKLIFHLGIPLTK